MNKIILAVLISLGLSGCVGPLVPNQTAETAGLSTVESASNIKIATAEEEKTLQSIGPIEGYSCKNKLWDPAATIEGATQQLKIVAAQRGATAIAGLTCEKGNFSVAKNCWESYRCTATALR